MTSATEQSIWENLPLGRGLPAWQEMSVRGAMLSMRFAGIDWPELALEVDCAQVGPADIAVAVDEHPPCPPQSLQPASDWSAATGGARSVSFPIRVTNKTGDNLSPVICSITASGKVVAS